MAKRESHEVKPTFSSPEVPLASHEDDGIFKVFALDVGLLGAMDHLDARMLLEGDGLFSSFRGSLAEQFVYQEMLASGLEGPAHYYRNEKTRGEVDFLVDGNRLLPSAIPVEVKSGGNLRAKSLTSFVRRFLPELAVRTSTREHARDGVIEDVPLYALGAFMGARVTGMGRDGAGLRFPA